MAAVPYQSIITLPYSSNALFLPSAYLSRTLLLFDFLRSYHNLSHPILTIPLSLHSQDPPSYTCQSISYLSAPIFLNAPHLTTLFFNTLDLTTSYPIFVLPSSSFSMCLISPLPLLTLYSLATPSDVGTTFNYYSIFLDHFHQRRIFGAYDVGLHSRPLCLLLTPTEFFFVQIPPSGTHTASGGTRWPLGAMVLN